MSTPSAFVDSCSAGAQQIIVESPHASVARNRSPDVGAQAACCPAARALAMPTPRQGKCARAGRQAF
eukprot:8241068-Alexandrium_andersonii.AAC.1